MKSEYQLAFATLVLMLFLTGCTKAQAGADKPPLRSEEITPHVIAANPQYSRYIADVKQLHADCLNALKQWEGYAVQGQDNPALYNDSMWRGYMGGTVEWIDDTCGKFDKLAPPRDLIALHGQLVTAASGYQAFTTSYVLGVAHYPEGDFLEKALAFLTAANDAYNLAATKFP